MDNYVNAATLAKASYTRSNVQGYSILKQHSSPDRTVYQRNNDGKVFIAFRGTDTSDFFQDAGNYAWYDKPTAYMKHGAKQLFESRAFRDISTDAAMALGLEKSALNRFRNAEKVTKQLVDAYGKNNVVAVGHSLGGSQSLHVSNKFGIEAHAIKPHITYNETKSFPHAYIYHNLTDPVSLLAPFARAKANYAGFDPRKRQGVEQHSIDPTQRFQGLPNAVLQMYKSEQADITRIKSALKASHSVNQ